MDDPPIVNALKLVRRGLMELGDQDDMRTRVNIDQVMIKALNEQEWRLPKR